MHKWRYEELENINCPSCTSTLRSFLLARSDGLNLELCSHCQLAYINPQPSMNQLQGFYSQGYFSGKTDFHRDQDYFALRKSSVAAITGQKLLES
jgi:hypothetical protein